MATLIQPIILNSTSISTAPPPSLKRTPKVPSLKIPQNPILSFTDKLVCGTPNKSLDEAYASFLDHCATQSSLSLGKQIHTHIIKRNYVQDLVFLGTKLVFMYGKCGSLLDAVELFDEMPERSIFTYNAMLGAYVSNGEPRKAIELYADMRFLNVHIDAHTCSCVLKPCSGDKYLRYGGEIHGYMIKCGLVCNDIVLNSLVTFYAKCNNIGAMKLLFDRSGRGDAVLWNLMISAYSSNGLCNEALKACKELSSGMQIHGAALKSGVCCERYVLNALVVMYSKCSRVDEAERVFANIVDRDSISWNSMLAAYVQNSLYNEALDLFLEITRDGKKPDQVSVISVLSACGRSRNLLNGMEVHAFALKNGMDLDLHVGNTIIDMYAKCSKTVFMDFAFRRIPIKDFVSWTTIIAGYVQNSCYMKALQSMREVLKEGIDIDRMMIESVLLASRGLKCISIAKEIHGYVIRRELSDLLIQNTIVDVYGECGEINYSRNVFESIEIKNVVSWTSMIDCYVHNRLAVEALELSSLMVREGVELDSIAILSILSAAANLSALGKGKEIHAFLIRRSLHLEESFASSLVDMYESCGAVDNSFKVFDFVNDKDLVLYTSMMKAYGMHGQGTNAIKVFRKMENENIIPDHIAFLSILSACSHSALVDEGKSFFNSMQCEYDLEPWPEHYACVVDLLGRANRLEEALDLIKSMKIKANAAVWCALLGACRTHLNMEIGEIAARKLLEIEPESPGNYVLVSNLYAAAERWEDVEEVRKRMRVKGLKKDPGCSWIEVGNKIHTFITRDRLHPQCDEIYEKLSEITEKLEREAGYRAETSHVLHNVEEREKVKMLHGHSERLALAYGLLTTPRRTPIRVTKNLRVCGDCHTFTKLLSKCFQREVVVRDANRFHHFEDGVCSCGDFWKCTFLVGS
ncbi:hypothetical protein ACS0TY_007491 [Phlomoides rotata]